MSQVPRERPADHRLAPLQAVVAAATVAVVFDTVWVSLRHAPAASYLALGAGLVLGTALLLGGLATAGRLSAAAGLGLWAALDGFLTYSSWLHGLAVGAGLGLAAWATLRRARGIPAGLAVGTALVLTWIVAPRAFSRLGFPRLETVGGSVLAVAVFAVALGLLGLYARRAQASGRRGILLPAAVLGILIVSGALFLGRAPTAASALVVPEGARDKPSIFVLVLDTVRADRLSAYGYERDTTPFLRDWAANPRVTLFPMAFATGSWTLPSHVSLLTGELPSSHGVHTRRPAPDTPVGAYRLVRSATTLPELLRDAGYRTGAFVANVMLTEARGIRRGFDEFVVPTTPRPLNLQGEKLRFRLMPHVAGRAVLPYPEAREISDRILDFVDRSAKQPVFVLANYMDAHSPYLPAAKAAGLYSGKWGGPPPLEPRFGDSPSRLEHASARYDEEIHGLDAEIERLFEELSRRGILDTSWVVVTSDHGEAFGEHGVVFHASSIYNEQVRVPLLIHAPKGNEVPVLTDAVDLLDVTATLSALATGRPLGGGRDLRQPGTTLRPVRIEFFSSFRTAGRDPFGPLTYIPARAVVARTTKLIEYPDRRELFDLLADPHEADDLASRELEHVEALVPLLPLLRSSDDVGDLEVPELSEEDQQRLRALGYVN